MDQQKKVGWNQMTLSSGLMELKLIRYEKELSDRLLKDFVFTWLSNVSKIKISKNFAIQKLIRTLRNGPFLGLPRSHFEKFRNFHWNGHFQENRKNHL